MDVYNILVIEDDEMVARAIERSLRSGELKVTTANSGVEGLKTARRIRPDLTILDVVMPGMDGYTVCREMRADPILTDTPIIFLTAKIKDEDRITGFKAGADDYLCKPFNIDELVLRVRAILRRATRQANSRVVVEAENGNQSALYRTVPVAEPVVEPNPIQDGHLVRIGDYILDTQTYEVKAPDKDRVRLTPVQYDLLYHLMTHPNVIFSPARLLDEVWDYPSDTGSPDLVRVHIKNLRERIETDPSNPVFIQTVSGYGYTIRMEE